MACMQDPRHFPRCDERTTSRKAIFGRIFLEVSQLYYADFDLGLSLCRIVVVVSLEIPIRFIRCDVTMRPGWQQGGLGT